MIYFYLICFLGFYLFVFYYLINNYRLNTTHLTSTIAFIIIYLPLVIVTFILLFLIYVIFSFLFIVELICNVGRDQSKFLKIICFLTSFIICKISFYKKGVTIIKYLNNCDGKTDFFYVKNINLVVNYAVSIAIIRCDIKILEELLEDFLYCYRNGINPLVWLVEYDCDSKMENKKIL